MAETMIGLRTLLPTAHALRGVLFFKQSAEKVIKQVTDKIA
jgi:hypothetical protein